MELTNHEHTRKEKVAKSLPKIAAMKTLRRAALNLENTPQTIFSPNNLKSYRICSTSATYEGYRFNMTGIGHGVQGEVALLMNCEMVIVLKRSI
ncbi:hypothetical protein SNEBB_008288 [Seison nebaliae]|nr:hypothetical protein SNEBB_008288 [Seison nebaliae]